MRTQIKRSDLSRYAIGKATGIDQSQLTRLMNKTGGLSIERLELLADVLDLTIEVRPKRRTRKAK